jgi:hypothetical protein
MLYIVSEDQLSDVVLRKIVCRYAPLNEFEIISFGKRGRGYIQNKINDFNNQQNIHFLILADLDSDKCAPELLNKWLKRPLRHNIVFRIAVREVESWLLADTKGISQYLNLDPLFIKKEVNNPDCLSNPKLKLLSFVKRCKNRNLREDLLREDNAVYRQGPGYNSRMSLYVKKYWKLERAVLVSDSFQRALNSIEQLNETLK